jgi:recombinational DNA repair protein RecR
MKKLFYLLALSMISVATMGEGTNFSGTWKLNNEKSILFDQFSLAPTQVIVTQTADTLTVEKHGNFQGTEYVTKDRISLDGKECVNIGWMNSKKTSTAAWSEDGKILTISSKLPTQDQGEATTKEVYQMVESNLKLELNAASSMGEMSETYLLDKQ